MRRGDESRQAQVVKVGGEGWSDYDVGGVERKLHPW